MLSSTSYLRIARVSTRARQLGQRCQNQRFTSKSNAPPEGIPLPENPFAKKAQARAKQLHNEIESIVTKHDQKRVQGKEKAKRFAGFADFLSKNKTNLSVVVVSSLTVVLSVKMVQNKQKYNLLEKEMKDTEAHLDEKRKLLKSITSDGFLAKMANNCSATLETRSPNNGKGWGWKAGGSKSNTEALVAVLSKDLRSLIGDAALSDDEKAAKDLEALRAKGNTSSDEADIQKLSALSERSEAEESEEEWVVDTDGKRTVKKSVFRI